MKLQDVIDIVNRYEGKAPLLHPDNPAYSKRLCKGIARRSRLMLWRDAATPAMQKLIDWLAQHQGASPDAELTESEKDELAQFCSTFFISPAVMTGSEATTLAYLELMSQLDRYDFLTERRPFSDHFNSKERKDASPNVAFASYLLTRGIYGLVPTANSAQPVTEHDFQSILSSLTMATANSCTQSVITWYKQNQHNHDLIKRSFTDTAQNRQNNNPLLIAIAKGRTHYDAIENNQGDQALETVLDNLFDVIGALPEEDRVEICNIKDKFGNTALHYAGIQRDIESVNKLIELGADPSIQNAQELTAEEFLTWPRNHCAQYIYLYTSASDPVRYFENTRFYKDAGDLITKAISGGHDVTYTMTSRIHWDQNTNEIRASLQSALAKQPYQPHTR